MNCFCAETRRISRMLTRLYDDALQPCGMTSAQFEVLGTLQGMGSSTQGDLVKYLAIDQTTLSRNLKLMDTHGWVRAEPDPKDGRRVVWKLTAAGRSLLQRAHRQWKGVDARMKTALGMRAPVVWQALNDLGAATGREVNVV